MVPRATENCIVSIKKEYSYLLEDDIRLGKRPRPIRFHVLLLSYCITYIDRVIHTVFDEFSSTFFTDPFLIVTDGRVFFSRLFPSASPAAAVSYSRAVDAAAPLRRLAVLHHWVHYSVVKRQQCTTVLVLWCPSKTQWDV